MPHDRKYSDAAPVSAPFRLPEQGELETTEQLRIAIDRGHSGDKVDAPDPAAAPLGTDDEAGGAPNTREQIRLAAQHEIYARPSQTKQETTGLGHAWWLIAYTLLIGVLVVGSFLWIQNT